jgi:hypothetical protein
VPAEAALGVTHRLPVADEQDSRLHKAKVKRQKAKVEER